MAKTRNIRTTTIPTLNIAPIDYNSATTTVFIEELCEINLNGLNIRKSLRILIMGILTLVKLVSIIEVVTIKKSN